MGELLTYPPLPFTAGVWGQHFRKIENQIISLMLEGSPCFDVKQKRKFFFGKYFRIRREVQFMCLEVLSKHFGKLKIVSYTVQKQKRRETYYKNTYK